MNEEFVGKSLKVLGGKWALIIVAKLEEPKRYTELRNEIPMITEKMLVQTLQILESSGLVKREEVKKSPLRVMYSLTDFGEEALGISPILERIGKSIFENVDSVKIK